MFSVSPMPVPICKYVDQNGLAAMLATKRSAGVTPEINLKNPLHTGNETHKWGIHPGCRQKCKTGVSVFKKTKKKLIFPDNSTKMSDQCALCNRVFHDHCTTQEWQQCQLCFGCTIQN